MSGLPAGRARVNVAVRDIAAKNLIDITGLTVRHGGNTVLANVDLSISAGEIVTIVGPNGSGKSTLLRAIIGAVAPASGQVRTGGVRIGYVPQRLHIDPDFAYDCDAVSQPAETSIRSKAADALAEAGVPDIGARQMTDLSGGQFQRVLLARALLTNPDVLLLDEPTQGLDQPGAASFYQQIEDVRARLGCAVLMVSHDLHVVMGASDRVICLNGHVCCHGTPEIVASAPEYRALFGTGTAGALALYRHHHDHSHDEDCGHDHSHQAAE